VGRRAADEEWLAARGPPDPSRVDVEAVAHRQRHGAPHGQDRVRGAGDEGVEGHHAVEARGIHLPELPQPPLEVLVAHAAPIARQRLGEHPEREPRQGVEQPRGDHLGAEDHRHVGRHPLERVAQTHRVGVLAELDEGGVDPGRRAGLERAGPEERALADERDAHASPAR
jgi:hypothetical protein